MFHWHSDLQSICDAPLAYLDADAIDLAHPAGAFVQYWNSLNAGQIPDRGQFSPQAIPKLLRWLMMFRREMNGDNDEYLLYLQGNSAAEMTRGSLQGQYLHEFTATGCFDTRRDVMRHVLETSQPAFARIIVGNDQSEFTTNVTVGAFPMTDGTNQPQVIMLPAPDSLELRMYL
ncbi:PAS domain-containing protein [Kordiimonas aquimaris]|uniref:PAS domain-containing protein n=1 Tax=Kordiimonas aquimaris TaxID=707591 RepID=UPI0021D12474|nr:PAS domain-containing protein [Kordiimonas aquimaris]